MWFFPNLSLNHSIFWCWSLQFCRWTSIRRWTSPCSLGNLPMIYLSYHEYLMKVNCQWLNLSRYCCLKVKSPKSKYHCWLNPNTYSWFDTLDCSFFFNVQQFSPTCSIFHRRFARRSAGVPFQLAPRAGLHGGLLREPGRGVSHRGRIAPGNQSCGEDDLQARGGFGAKWDAGQWVIAYILYIYIIISI